MRYLLALLLVGCTTVVTGPTGPQHNDANYSDAGPRPCDPLGHCVAGLRCVGNRCIP